MPAVGAIAGRARWIADLEPPLRAIDFTSGFDTSRRRAASRRAASTLPQVVIC